jgi:hypothetical protein
MAETLDEAELRRLYHHVFLPPKLPQSSDESTNIDRVLLKATRKALKEFPAPSSTAIINSIKAIDNLKGSRRSAANLSQVLITLADGQTAPLHICSQNAGILVTRKQNDLIFESFELSPTNSAVFAAKGRLTRCFPAIAIAVNTQVHPLHELVPVIAQTLHELSTAATPEMQPESKKAGTEHKEYRDTTSPALVTELFFGFLRGFGKPVSVSSISKHTREEVLWEDALAPWRRSSTWLLIRVTLHLVITRSQDGSDHVYKRLMAFIMSQILHAATLLRLPNDILYAMSAKIVCRVHKLRSTGSANDDELLADIDGVLQKASDVIAGRWETVQNNETRTLDLRVLATMNTEHDTRIALPALDAHIVSLKNRTSKAVVAEFQPASSLLKFCPTELPSLPGYNSQDHHYATANLQAFESWISQNIDGWIDSHLGSAPHLCDQLYNHIKAYHGLASIHYRDNPEGASVMILAIFELWVACDKLAVSQYPMLAEYPPGIPLEQLQNLLLPFLQQMERLHKVEAYLERRTRQAGAERTSNLFSTDSPRAFAARYFRGSRVHQDLKDRIVREANESKQAKQTEYTLMKREYERLHGLYARATCEFRTVVVDADDYGNTLETREVHRSDCQKCLYLQQRDALQIKVHEWPLPTNDTKSASVVFELNVPAWYAAWRDSRAFLLHNVIKGTQDATHLQASFSLASDDPHLTQKFVGHRNKRIGLLSQQKPVVRSHYAVKKITEVTVDSVCQQNGLNYDYWDGHAYGYVVPFKFDDTVQQSCTYTLPTPGLQHYLFRPSRSPDGEAPNLVLATQDACPDNMSLDEYKELATIPLGHHIQWVNILQQLAMPGVDFKKIKTTLMFLQCIKQAGPPSDNDLRESHAIFRTKSRAVDIMSNLDIAVERIKQNWESAQALSLFASIATRVLALKDTAQEFCLPLLAKVRKIAMGWIHTLREAAHFASNDGDRIMFIAKSVEIAFICGSTYDVEERHLPTLLSSVDDCSVLIQASIVAQHGKDTQKTAPSHIQMLRERFTRTLHRSYKILGAQHKALDDAVKQSWSAYTPGAEGWSNASPTVDDWVTTLTEARGGASLRVHYNILSGELLLNGVPLDQPPQEYRSRDLYPILFGKSIVEVMPSLTPGFQFSTKRTFGRYEVLIGLQDCFSDTDTELVVRGLCGSVMVETLPTRLLGDNFPEEFTQKYVHWYNFTSGHVEFRPIKEAWNSRSPATWTLQKTQDSTWQLLKDSNALVGLQSPTAKTISTVLKPLADPERTHCIVQHQDKSLNVELPLLDLSVSLPKDTSLLTSKEYPSMSVDSDQALGTLIGFSNKLMLVTSSGDRLLLLPEADLDYEQHQAHISVRACALENISKVHALRVDRQLDRLVDQGDLGCKFYLAYVHALTSGCLADPLTHMTGTEQALVILNSCAVRSFSQLSQANIDILSLIANLSPGRHYYPTSKRVMQTVMWDEQLSFLSQHARLRLSV